MSSDLDGAAGLLDAYVEQWGLTAAKSDQDRERGRAEGWGLDATGLALRRLITAAKAFGGSRRGAGV